MTMLTVIDVEVRGLLPCMIFDANGRMIRRQITRFDPETGEVESYVMTNLSGKFEFLHVLHPKRGECLKTRMETYPAPLTYRRATEEERAEINTPGYYWDEHEAPTQEMIEEYNRFQEYRNRTEPKFTLTKRQNPFPERRRKDPPRKPARSVRNTVQLLLSLLLAAGSILVWVLGWPADPFLATQVSSMMGTLCIILLYTTLYTTPQQGPWNRSESTLDGNRLRRRLEDRKRS